MECPHCKLLNPETAQRCDCGYNFTTKTLEEPYDRSVPRKTINVLKIAAALVSLGISVLYARGPGNNLAGWFVVGPIFGAVVVIWHPKFLQDSVKRGSFRSILFPIAATAIWVFLYGLGTFVYLRASTPAGPSSWLFPAPLVSALVGAVLLPLAHKALLGASWTRITVAIPCLCVAYYYIGLLLFEVLGVGMDFFLVGFVKIPDYTGHGHKWINGISLWQVIYLLCMFAPLPKFLRSFQPSR